MYENWKIKKSDYKEKEDEYTEVAIWCNQTGQFYIEETEDEFRVVKVPDLTIEQRNEIIRETRQRLFTEQADPLKYNYEECLARYGETDERTIEAKNIWLAKKDEIRKNNPYIEESKETATSDDIHDSEID